MEEDFDTAPNDGFDLAFEVYRILEGWSENRLMRRPCMAAAFNLLTDEQVLAWCEQTKAIGLGGTT